MTTIKNLETTLYRLPLPEPVAAAAAGVMSEFEMVMVRVTDSDGHHHVSLLLYRITCFLSTNSPVTEEKQTFKFLQEMRLKVFYILSKRMIF